MRNLLFTFALIAAQISWAQKAQKDYFQQHVDYNIDVRLDDQNHFISGYESLIYTNNSKESLGKIYMHLWPNAYKNKQTALAKQLTRQKNFILYSTLKDDKGFIDSLDFKVNGESIVWHLDSNNIDIGVLYLNTPLQPGQSITITTPFRVKLPSGSISRLGHIGQSYQITQWYPKPAVFDREGWHAMPYLTQGEFYSEFGNYDVRITIPANYVVGATGILQNESEIQWLDDLANQPFPSDTLYKNSFPATAKTWKTIEYKQKNVHDFGWFADKRWIVRKGEVVTPYTKTKVTTWAMFTPASQALWSNATQYIGDATYYYSLWNGDYPYTVVTAVDGTISAGGGMEYPNVTVIGNASSAEELETVIMHEVGHNWFYGILGSNERDNAWMDEGINSFNEDRYNMLKHPNSNAVMGIQINGNNNLSNLLDLDSMNYWKISQLTYLFTANYGIDQPLSCHSNDFLNLNYGANVYKKTAVVFYYLQQYLGVELFDKCMQRYFSEWKFKHPTPADFQQVFEETSGQDLDWFFNSYIQGYGKPDFTISCAKKVKGEEGVYKVKIRNTGSTYGPCPVTLTDKANGRTTAWSSVLAPGHATTVQLKSTQPVKQFEINANSFIPEISNKNNLYRYHKLLPTVEPLKIKFLTGFPNKNKTQLYIAPTVSWNMYNHVAFGAVLHNQHVLNRRWQWSINPMYSIAQHDFVGIGKASLRLGKWTFGGETRKFYFVDQQLNYGSQPQNYLGHYWMTRPSIKWTSKGRPRNYPKQFIEEIEIATTLLSRSITWDLLNQTQLTTPYFNQYLHMNYHIGRKLGLKHRLDYYVNCVKDITDANAKGVQLSSTVQYQYMYNLQKQRSIDLTVFSGLNSQYALTLWNPTGMTGANDFTFNQLYMGRSETSGIWSNQIQNGHGLIATPTFQSFNFRLISTRLEYTLPTELNVKLYGATAWGINKVSPATSLLSFADPNLIDTSVKTSTTFMWSTGVHFIVGPNIAEVFVPLISSQNIIDSQKAHGIKWQQSFTVKFNLTSLNPFELVGKALSKTE
jgi:hypothetical protein